MSTKRNQREETNRMLIQNSLREALFYSPILLAFMAMAISFSLACFVAGLPGLFSIIKKEAPTGPYYTSRGAPAVIIGIIYLVMFWGAGIFFFFVEFLGYRF